MPKPIVNSTNLIFFDHFSAPSSINDPLSGGECLSSFGAPISPDVILGGFNGTAYENSTTLIITFVVNNHKNQKDLGKALAWEKAFIAFMTDYAKSNKDLLKISFSAERSVQDELHRESFTDITTIIVSYLIMFAYITIALGQVNHLDRIMVCRTD